MTKYVLLYQGGTMPQSPEEGEKVMSDWMAWFGKAGSAILDMGNAYGPATALGASPTEMLASGVPERGSRRTTRALASLATQTEPAPAASADGRACTAIGRPALPLRASIRTTVASTAEATQTAP